MKREVIRNPVDRAAEDWIVEKFHTPANIIVPLVWWFDKLYQNNARAAIKDINKACGTNYPVRRYREWLRGSTKLPENTRRYLIQEVLTARMGPKIAKAIIFTLGLEFEEPSYADLL